MCMLCNFLKYNTVYMSYVESLLLVAASQVNVAHNGHLFHAWSEALNVDQRFVHTTMCIIAPLRTISAGTVQANYAQP